MKGLNFIKISLLSACSLWFVSCTQIDDYMLGKDNTPKPKALTPIVSRVAVTPLWSINQGKSNSSRVYLKLKPVIRAGVVYTADTTGHLEAVSQKSGHVIWSTQLKHGVFSGPVISQGYIAVGTDAATIVILDQAHGREQWHAKLSSDVLSKVIIANSKVIAKTIDGHLYAFDLKTGEKLWVVDHGAPNLILKASSSPVILGNLVFVGYADGRLDAVDIFTGHVVWQRSIAYATGASDVERLVDIDADPIVRKGVAYLATYQGYVGALRLDDGQFIWNKPASVYKNFTIDEHSLYLVDVNDQVWSIDRQSGQVKWKQTALKAHGLTEPVLMKNYLIAGDKMGYLHVLNLKNGEMIGRTSLDAAIDISPAVSGNQLFVVTANGKLFCLTVG